MVKLVEIIEKDYIRILLIILGLIFFIPVSIKKIAIVEFDEMNDEYKLFFVVFGSLLIIAGLLSEWIFSKLQQKCTKKQDRRTFLRFDFLHEIIPDKTTIGDLPVILKNELNEQHLKNSDYVKVKLDSRINNDVLTRIPKYYNKQGDYDKNRYEFISEKTRISTFFAFIDSNEKEILILDRLELKDEKTLEQNYLDCFGSVGFENISIGYKILNQNFFESKIKSIQLIPGCAIESNCIEKDKKNYIETALMFGFIIKISKDDLQKALQPNNPNGSLSVKRIHDLSLNPNTLTSKTALAITYLKGLNENETTNL